MDYKHMEIYELQSQYINISTIDAIHKYHLVLRTSMAKFINGIIIINTHRTPKMSRFQYLCILLMICH